MNIRTVVAVASLCFTGTFAAHCLTDAECGQDECCFRHDGPLIVSRRQAQLLPIRPSSEGVCEKYQKEGAHCSVFAMLNGHCSCGPGLQCTFVPEPTIALQPVQGTELVASKRSMVYPGTGTYKCMLKA